MARIIRTTLNIDKDLHHKLSILAAIQRKSLRELSEEYLWELVRQSKISTIK